MSWEMLHKHLTRYPYLKVRRGARANEVLVNWDLFRSSRPTEAIMYVSKYGDPAQFPRENLLLKYLHPDYAAGKWYSEYNLENGEHIKPERQREYTANASVLNAIVKLYNVTRQGQKARGSNADGLWVWVAGLLNSLPAETYQGGYAHTLPTNPVRLKEKMRKYESLGYVSLVHGGHGNQNTRIINDMVERLVLSIYCTQELPFGEWVHDYYLQFLAGTRQYYDGETGLMFDREDFFDEKRGTYRSISRGSVWNIINDTENKIIIDRLRNNRIDHITKSTPYNHRHLPQYSLSKISMDDRTYSRKEISGRWFNAYLAFDVLSDVILACVRSIERPTVTMIWDCFRDMYRFIDANHLVWPGEVEVENHLMKDIEEDLNGMFQYVTFCAPGLSRSKRAEHKIKAFKYGTEKRSQAGTGRWNGKGAYKTKSEGKDEDYKQPRLSVERLTADDLEAINQFNHALHPNQKMFPGKTRWQVLAENMNPDLSRPQKHKLYRYLGYGTETSIRNNDFARVQYEDYAIDNQHSIGRLKPNNYGVEAYYMPDADGNIGEVFLYQGETFISKATKIERYNEAKIERTVRDEELRTGQAKRQAHFFKTEKDNIEKKITRKIAHVEHTDFDAIKPAIVQPLQEPEMDIDALVQEYSGAWMKERSINEL